MLNHFKLINEPFFIDEDFDVVVDMEDISSEDKTNIGTIMKKLISVNFELKAYISNLSHNDYMFNFLSLFLNETARDIYGQSCIKFGLDIDFDYAKKYFSETKLIEGFFIYKTKGEKNETRRKIITLENSISNFNFYEKKRMNFNDKEELVCNLGEYTALAFTDFKYLNNYCCIDIQQFEGIFNEDFPTTTIKSVLIHETPHLIAEDANSSLNKRVLSPCIKGVHKTDLGENGELLEYLIMVNTVYFILNI